MKCYLEKAWAFQLPGENHVVIHLLQLLLGDIKGVRRWIQFICLEAFVGEVDSEMLVIFLQLTSSDKHMKFTVELLTSGTFSLSVCDEAASVVTARRQAPVKAPCLSPNGRLDLSALENMSRLSDACVGNVSAWDPLIFGRLSFDEPLRSQQGNNKR